MLDLVVALLFGVFALIVFVDFVRHSPVDKKKHLVVSAVGVVVVSLIASLFWGIETGLNVGFWVMFLAGIGKELYDKYIEGEFFSIADMSFNLVGILFGLLFSSLFWKILTMRL